MTDTELIRRLKEHEYDTAFIIVDTEGNEYDVEDVSLTMGGQYHQVIKIKKYPKEDNWFRTPEQSIEDKQKEINYYNSKEFEDNCMKLGKEEGEKLLKYYREKGIPHLQYCINYYKKLLNI